MPDTPSYNVELEACQNCDRNRTGLFTIRNRGIHFTYRCLKCGTPFGGEEEGDD